MWKRQREKYERRMKCILTVFTLFVNRGLSLFFLSPMLRKLGYGMSWEHTLVVWMGALNGSFNLLLGSSAVLGHKPGVDNGRKVAKYFLFSPQFLALFLFLYLRMVCVRARARGGSCKMREESLFSCLFTKCSFSVTWPLSSCWSKSSTRASHERCWKSSVNGLDLYMQCKIPWRVAIPRWRRVSDTPVTD